MTGARALQGPGSMMRALRIGVGAIAGGTASKLTGGKFANGAATAAFSAAVSEVPNRNNKQSNGYDWDDEAASTLVMDGTDAEDPTVKSILKAKGAQKKVYVDYSGIEDIDWGEGVNVEDVKTSALATLQAAFPHINFVEGSGGPWSNRLFFTSEIGPEGYFGAHNSWGTFFTRPRMKVYLQKIHSLMQPVFTNDSQGNVISARNFTGVEAGIAIGNYGAHELGHRFFGPQHVSSPGYIMTEYTLPSYNRWQWHWTNMLKAHYAE